MAFKSKARAWRAEELMDAGDTVYALSKHFVTEMRKVFA
jgi:hypothetical protein